MKLIPAIDETYVPFGDYQNLSKIIESKLFFPVYIYGPSGNGKTTMVSNICAKQKRELIRINLNNNIDEDVLIGSKTLKDGNIEIVEGPVIKAMRLGAVLLIDEIDKGNANLLMCIQGILEGGTYYFKQKDELVMPAEGFTVIATANTKGQGTITGKEFGTNILDDAFLERFVLTIEQEYPSIDVEREIVQNHIKKLNTEVDEDIVESLLSWADNIRETYVTGGIDDIITTRRLIHIIKAYSVIEDIDVCVDLAVNRFDEHTSSALYEIWDNFKPRQSPTLEEEIESDESVFNSLMGF